MSYMFTGRQPECERPEWCGKWDAVQEMGDVYFGEDLSDCHM